jgi:N-succinyl-L-ornithine transcarbamylase
MRHFTSITDLGDLKAAVSEARQIKARPFAWQNLGKNKTLLMIFFNSSLRTRLSTQKAALNLGIFYSYFSSLSSGAARPQAEWLSPRCFS